MYLYTTDASSPIATEHACIALHCTTLHCTKEKPTTPSPWFSRRVPFPLAIRQTTGTAASSPLLCSLNSNPPDSQTGSPLALDATQSAPRLALSPFRLILPLCRLTRVANGSAEPTRACRQRPRPPPYAATCRPSQIRPPNRLWSIFFRVQDDASTLPNMSCGTHSAYMHIYLSTLHNYLL